MGPVGAWGGAGLHSSQSPWLELRLTGACLCSSEALGALCVTVPIHRARLLAGSDADLHRTGGCCCVGWEVGGPAGVFMALWGECGADGRMVALMELGFWFVELLMVLGLWA